MTVNDWHETSPYAGLPCRQFCTYRAKGCAPGECKNPYDRSDPRYWIGRGNDPTHSLRFGGARLLERQALEAWVISKRPHLHPLDVRRRADRIAERLAKSYFARRPPLGARITQQRARPEFTREELQHLADLFADANDPESRAIGEKALEILKCEKT